MRAALWLLGLFAIAAAVALFAGNNQGTVTVFWPPWRVDLSLNLVLLLLFGAFVFLHLALRGFSALFALPTQARQWRLQQKERALHSALMSGVRAALMRGLSGPEAVEAAIIHASGSVPDAIKALKPDAGVLTRIAEAKLRDAMNELPLFAGVQEGLAG